MSLKPFAAFALLTGLAAQPAPAAETVALPRFEGVELRGGGSAVIRHGAVQRVTLIEGSTSHTGVRVEQRGRGGHARLVIDACKVRCPRDYRLRIEIVTPDISAVAVNGGGRIDVARGFAPGRHIAAAVNGGGQIDARALPGRDVAAAVNGGGRLQVTATGTLAASVNGGGAILYWGDPQVASSIRGGGAVTKGR
ncbi:MAG TPA: DUF2807 domain-containing protein [Allosphingosinicella sp.]|jgi:hypothetical protein